MIVYNVLAVTIAMYNVVSHLVINNVSFISPQLDSFQNMERCPG